MKKWKFISLVVGHTPVESDTFEGAFRAMYAYVKSLIASGNATHQELETAIWIEAPTGLPLYFYNALDMAWDAGLMDRLKSEEDAAAQPA